MLIVEDHLDSAKTLAVLLGLEGFTAQTAYNATAAMAIALKQRPDVVFLDLHLPGASGHELARRMLDQIKPPPVLVAMTGMQHTEELCRAEGFAHYFLKPADPLAILALLRGYAAQLE